MDGFIIVNKPKDMTSHAVCNKIRSIMHTKKVGHSGTLDPLATGVLVVAVGKATKLINYLENQDKTYVAEALFGIQTDSYDILGNVLNKDDLSNPTDSEIDTQLEILKQSESQIPPIYSAIKVNGKKLYDYAKNGEMVEILPRKIKIHSLKRVSNIIDKKVSIEVSANKGFYVRSLINDLGISLNTYAVMSNLIRTKAGKYDITISQTLEEIKENGPIIHSIEDTFSHLKRIDVNDYMAKLVLNGVILDERQFNLNEMFKIYHNDKLIAIYEPFDDKKYKLVIKLVD
jgi:tRNA pseudouridine55 synthase